MKARLTALALTWLAATSLATASDLAEEKRHRIQLEGHQPFAALASGAGTVLGPDAFAVGPESADSGQALLRSIAAWLSSEFGLPLIEEPPAIVFVSRRRIAFLLYRNASPGLRGDGWGSAHAEMSGEQNVFAGYDTGTRTIYLPDGWSGKTSGEISMLVHEMVHHIQNMADLRFACPEEREKLAFEAQDRFLALFGSDLEAEFGLDPFTILASTNCWY